MEARNSMHEAGRAYLTAVRFTHLVVWRASTTSIYTDTSIDNVKRASINNRSFLAVHRSLSCLF